MSDVCKVCGRELAEQHDDRQRCARGLSPDLLNNALACYRLGYDRERARADAAEKERDELQLSELEEQDRAVTAELALAAEKAALADVRESHAREHRERVEAIDKYMAAQKRVEALVGALAGAIAEFNLRADANEGKAKKASPDASAIFSGASLAYEFAADYLKTLCARAALAPPSESQALKKIANEGGAGLGEWAQQTARAALPSESAPQPGVWPQGCVQRAFVEGASWLRYEMTGFTSFASEHEEAEAEAVRRYGAPLPAEPLSQPAAAPPPAPQEGLFMEAGRALLAHYDNCMDPEDDCVACRLWLNAPALPLPEKPAEPAAPQEQPECGAPSARGYVCNSLRGHEGDHIAYTDAPDRQHAVYRWPRVPDLDAAPQEQGAARCRTSGVPASQCGCGAIGCGQRPAPPAPVSAPQSANADFYDTDDGKEYLVHTTPEDALDAWLDDQHGNPEPPGTVTVYAFARSTVSEKWLKSMAIRLAENLSESWGEEYGDPDGDHAIDTGALTTALLPIIGTMARETEVWQCRQVAKRDFTLAEVRALLASPSLEKPAPPRSAKEEEPRAPQVLGKAADTKGEK